MGKPFKKELGLTLQTHQWALRQNVSEIKAIFSNNQNLPLFVVGSGGSLSACYYAVMLYQEYGIMAKAITPLELVYSKKSLRNSNVLFITASGRNTDILFSYKKAVECEPNKIYCLCTSVNSPISKLAAQNSISTTFEFKLESGKDGFLATNSLIAFFTILYKAYNKSQVFLDQQLVIQNSFLSELDSFIELISPNFTFSVLYAGWGQPIAIDLESKMAEAALGNILISDFRNFGHGRHHWFDKRSRDTAIVALITQDEEHLATKTLSLLPSNIPTLTIKSNHSGALSSIELLLKSFYLIERLGRLQKIDPGRPGVPEFGSKLYHLNYEKLYPRSSDSLSENIKLAITRKANTPSFDDLSSSEKEYWLNEYTTFLKMVKAAEFGALIFDYDGTLCSFTNRFTGIDNTISNYLINFLEQGIIIGIATGRGQSVRKDLQKVIPKKYQKEIIIGYYNCSELGLLSDDNIPSIDQPINSSLEKIYSELKRKRFAIEILPELRSHQVTIVIDDKENWSKVRVSIIQFVISLNITNIQILESSHSMDIIDQTETNKLKILDPCLELLKARGLSENCLCIGDKGKWPGNDYQLLSHPYSLSVDEVSSLGNSCWNLSKPGIKNLEATLYYLSILQFKKRGLTLNIL